MHIPLEELRNIYQSHALICFWQYGGCKQRGQRSTSEDFIKNALFMPRLAICSRDLHWHWLTGPYSAIQWRCQCSAELGWPSHSMCSSPHWQVGYRVDREKLSPANWEQRLCGEQISRKIVSRELGQGVTAISRKISRSWAPKKWGPTCDRDISNSAIYTTAIYAL